MAPRDNERQLVSKAIRDRPRRPQIHGSDNQETTAHNPTFRHGARRRRKQESNPVFISAIEETLHNLALENKHPSDEHTEHQPLPRKDEVSKSKNHKPPKATKEQTAVITSASCDPVSHKITLPAPRNGEVGYDFKDCHPEILKVVPDVDFFRPPLRGDDRFEETLAATFTCSNTRSCREVWGGQPVEAVIRKYEYNFLPMEERKTFGYNVRVLIQHCARCGRAGDMVLDLDDFVNRVAPVVLIWKGQGTRLSRKSGPVPIVSRPISLHKSKVDPLPTVAHSSPPPPSPPPTPQTSYIFPDFQSAISQVVTSIKFSNSNNPGDVEIEKNLVGSFTCSNPLCKKEWDSGLIATVIRKYEIGTNPTTRNRRKEKEKYQQTFTYNALVYNQHCKRCDNLGLISLNQEIYIKRVSRQLMIWKGMDVPPIESFGSTTRPHDWERCEGCIDRRFKGGRRGGHYWIR